MNLLVILIPLFGAITAGLIAVSVMPQKSPLTEKLEEIQARNLSGPQYDRFAAMEKIFGDDGRSQMQRQLMEAGWYTTTPAQIGARVGAGLIFGFGLGLIPLLIVRPFMPILILVAFLPAIIGAYVPFLLLNQAISSRKMQVQRSLPDFLDMVATTVQAGISLNAALGYAIGVAPGALGDEIKWALSQIRLGRARAEALRAAAARINQSQLTSTISAITQAEKLGANVSHVLNELAEDVRNHRIMLVEEQAAKMPIKMVFPMALFLLPALFSIIFGALAAQLLPTVMNQ